MTDANRTKDEKVLDCPTCGQGHAGKAAEELADKLTSKNDLIQRLRGAADGTLRPVHAYSLCAEAADALERLTRERDECLKHCNDDEGYEATR